MKVKKGDKVKIITGKDRGKSGKIIKVDTKANTVIVEGLNLYKKHQRPRRQGEKGEIINLPRPMHSSNVKLICSNCGDAVKIGYRSERDYKRKIRYCKKCQAII